MAGSHQVCHQYPTHTSTYSDDPNFAIVDLSQHSIRNCIVAFSVAKSIAIFASGLILRNLFSILESRCLFTKDHIVYEARDQFTDDRVLW